MTKEHRPAVMAAIIAIVVYAITLGGTYIYDDMYIVREDTRVLEIGGWRGMWTQDYNHGAIDNLYRPIVSMTYWLQWRIHGDQPWAFHLVNVLLHAGVCALVAELGRRLLGRRAAYIAGILFAVHPIHVEAVAGIVGRAESMCALGMLGAMVLFMHRPMTTRRAIAIWGCTVLAILCKEQGMLLPFILLFLDRFRDWKPRVAVVVEPVAVAPPALEYAPGHLHDPIKAEQFARQMLTLMLCFSLAGYIYLRENVLRLKFYWDRNFLDWTIQPMIRSTGSDRWLMPLVLLGRYTALLVAPLRLSIDYGGSAIGWVVDHSDPYLYFGIVAVAMWIVIAALAIQRRRGVLLFLLISLAMTYGVVGNVVSLIGTNFGERLMYLPSAFFLLIVAEITQRSQRDKDRKEDREEENSKFKIQNSKLNSLRSLSLCDLCVVLISILFIVRTVTYAWEWNDRLRMYKYSLDRQPKSIRLYMLLADELTKRGDFVAAERIDAAGRVLQPDYWDIYVQSAVIAEKLGKVHDADLFFLRAYDIQPSMPIVFMRNGLRARHPELIHPPATTTATTRSSPGGG